LLRSGTSHRSLPFKRIGQFWSVRVGLHYRSSAIEAGRDVVWFWIGSHDEDDHLSRLKFAKALPHAFTEHGAIMAASVRHSRRAVEVAVFVVRAGG
jgi:hypothetical protein